MTDNKIFKPTSKKLTIVDDGAYITLYCYPSDAHRENRLFIQEDDFLFLALAFGMIIDREGFDIYECYSVNKRAWLILLHRAQKLTEFDSFEKMYDYVKQGKTKMAMDYSYLLENYPEEVWKEREEIQLMLKDIIRWTEFVMKDGDKIEILGI